MKHNDELALFEEPDEPHNDGLSDMAIDALSKHSGRYVQERNPKLFKAICLLIQWGIALQTIAEELCVSRNLVASIADGLQPVSLEHHKRELVAGLQRLSRAALRRLIEMIESGVEIPAQALGVILGISVEKEQLVAGAPTAIVHHTEDPDIADMRRFLAASRRAAGMDSGAGSLLANEGPPAVPAPSVRPTGQVIDIPPQEDNESPGNGAGNLDNA